MRRFSIILAATVLSAAALAQPITGPQPTLPQSSLTIDTGEEYLRFVVELADDDRERQRGLMFRRDVPPDEGMLFDFMVDSERAFWMKNTLVSLDMVFIRSDGTIHRIAPNTIPLSERSVPSFGPVSAVLELAAGRAAELGIEPGDIVRHQIFNNNPPLKRVDVR
jgi:uncharacterized membrane protein (UPF0127 family)